MFKIEIKNKLTQELTNQAEFPTLDEANAWVDSQEAEGVNKNAWGRYFGERSLPKKGLGYTNELDYNNSLVINESEHDNNGQTWINLYPEYDITIIDITEIYNEEQDEITKKSLGKAAREKCQNVLDYIAGYNLESAFTLEQITTMQTTFADVESALRASRPDLGLQAVAAATPDGTVVTEGLKNKIIAMLL